MARKCQNQILYAPLYIHSFPLCLPCALTEAQRFFKIHENPTQIEHISDKLLWFRYKKALRQQDIADWAGLTRSAYSRYETKMRDLLPLETLTRIALILEVTPYDLMDDYHRFIYSGNSYIQIKSLRKQNGMTQKEFAAYVGVSLGTVQKWELPQGILSKSIWSTLFRATED